MFDPLSKHQEESRVSVVLPNTVLSVWYVFLIEAKTKKKTEK